MKFGAGIQSVVRVTLLLLVPATPLVAAQTAHLSIDASKPGAKIDRNIFGQFAENLGDISHHDGEATMPTNWRITGPLEPMHGRFGKLVAA